MFIVRENEVLMSFVLKLVSSCENIASGLFVNILCDQTVCSSNQMLTRCYVTVSWVIALIYDRCKLGLPAHI